MCKSWKLRWDLSQPIGTFLPLLDHRNIQDGKWKWKFGKEKCGEQISGVNSSNGFKDMVFLEDEPVKASVPKQNQVRHHGFFFDALD